MAAKFRPEFGQYMSDKTYFNACRLRDTLKSTTLKSEEKTVLQKAFNTLLQLNRRHADVDRGFQERQHQREYSTGREKDRIFQEQQRKQEQDRIRQQESQLNYEDQRAMREMQKAAWQNQSDQLHNAYTRRRTPTYTQAATTSRQGNNGSQETSIWPFLIVLAMILYLYVTW